MTARRSPVLTTLLAATAMLGGGLPSGLLDDASSEPKPRDEVAIAAAESKRDRKRAARLARKRGAS